MASTTKKGSKHNKAKLGRPNVKTSVAEQAQTIAELRQELAEARNRDFAESPQRENATAKELHEASDQQTATTKIFRLSAVRPRSFSRSSIR